MPRLSAILPILPILAIAACSSLPPGGSGPESHALMKSPNSGVAGRFAREAARHPGESGFAVLDGNREAFTDRVALIDFAEKTLDVQYYIWSADTIGLMLADRLVRAADRGVRVRFLLDDVNFKKRDSATASLAAHPNIEVRIFNPHRYRSLRGAEFLANFGRLNKRMHNKILVMDNTCAIVGGRNIADQYFGLNEDFNNRDLDIAAAGPIVREISATFDEFWNSEAAIPIGEIVREERTMEDFHRQVATLRGNIRPERYPFPLDQDVASLRKRVDAIARNLVWAKADLLYDSFASLKQRGAGENVVDPLRRAILEADDEVLIEAAYFVMREPAIENLASLHERGVKVRVLTNALAGNDVVAAQAGHTKRRGEVLDSGVELYELRPDAAAVHAQLAPAAENSRAALHTKSLVIDRKSAFVGSYNLDPRSQEINSEIGLLVHSPEFARQVAEFLDEGVRPENAYHVTRGDHGGYQWRTVVDGQARTWNHDPETTWTRRFLNSALMWLPIEDQL